MSRINKDFLDELKRTFNKFRVTLVVGKDGVGKMTGIDMLASDLKLNIVEVDTKMQGIREFQQVANEIQDEVIFVINDANTMSQNSQNALLKILEEPKQNLHIYLVASSLSGFLETLIRRVEHVVNVGVCKKTDLQLYDKLNFERLQSDFGDIIVNNLSSFTEFEDLLSTDPSIIAFCDKVINNIRQVSTPNAFKIANSLKLSESQSGYDLGVFISIVTTLALHKFRATASTDALRVFVAGSKAMRRYENKEVSSKAIVDLFIMEARCDS